ncbi:hypothetical protein Q3V23_30560 [Streptomyces sp. VNUA116]|uniref:hypothetical protein n=1 Tax=Streptomyces sp. VNUA116 TaxID=3062449 RepID=UPI002675D723|nr:hypothetical protein [Streptomyces sp. VNUA116]WKU48050.1 hypothetical protein Q3V23_30560 [Streptomyces sp. VNUA116]
MVQNLVAVFSLLIGLAGLTLSYATHRQKVREEEQESALRSEELRKFQRDREQEQQLHEQEKNAQRQQERQQASMISAHIALPPSPLHDSWVVPKVVIQNGSNQPVTDVRVSFRGKAIGEWPLLGTGEGTFSLPPTQIPDPHSDQLRDIAVEFTDVAGTRWRRAGYGVLQRARQDTSSPETSGAWETPEPPVIEPAARPTGPPSRPLPGDGSGVGGGTQPDFPAPPPAGGAAQRPAQRRRAIGFLRQATVLVSVILIAGSLWWLLHS